MPEAEPKFSNCTSGLSALVEQLRTTNKQVTTLPPEYIISKFYQLVPKAYYNENAKAYVGCCPVCHEGKSWLKKKRLFYFPLKDYLYCHNCSTTWNVLDWLKEAGGMSYMEVLREAQKFSPGVFTPPATKKKARKDYPLPKNSIDLFDPIQLEHYKDNRVVMDAMTYVSSRRINTAVNRVKTLYVSLDDYIHKNRICIPFYDENGKIFFYQTRAIYQRDMDKFPKYLSKEGGDKPVFGVERVNPKEKYLFIFEGPIDSMFVKNGVAMGSISINALQQKQLGKYSLYDKIWVLDNQLDNPEVKKKMLALVRRKERVVIWPRSIKEKDVNEWCVNNGKDEMPGEFFIKNSYTGNTAMVRVCGASNA